MKTNPGDHGANPPTWWIIAGPNAVGKTIFALEFLPRVAGCTRFINTDLIAGLAPLAPLREVLAASRIVLRELDARIEARDSFALETTLAGRSYLRLTNRLRRGGWRVELIYLALPSAEIDVHPASCGTRGPRRPLHCPGRHPVALP
jgi:predicted ABC-type ATPase